MGLTAKMESFDSFWEAPEDIEKGYSKFATFYRRNYLEYIPKKKDVRILVISCGAGYFVSLLHEEGYSDVLGIDSDSQKVSYAQKKGLNCRADEAFPFLEARDGEFDVIIAEQEINHLTTEEILRFLELARNRLAESGTLIVHSINGANPVTGSESLAQNIDHYNSFTPYSLSQLLEIGEFSDIEVFPLNLFVFYRNPLNYIGLVVDKLYTLFFRFSFALYGKSNKIFTKKIGAVCIKKERSPRA